jgi:hypothetical protein
MSEKPVRSIDELFVEFRKAVDRLDLIENLMRDHANAQVERQDPIYFFAEQIGVGVRDMYEYLSEIKLAMDVEAHRKI